MMPIPFCVVNLKVDYFTEHVVGGVVEIVNKRLSERRLVIRRNRLCLFTISFYGNANIWIDRSTNQVASFHHGDSHLEWKLRKMDVRNS